MNLHRNNSFVNQTQLPLLCEKSGTILLVVVDLMTDRPGGQQSDEILVDFKFFTDRIVRIFTVFNEGTVIVLPMHFSLLFW